jgi:hypothetical protein
MSDKLLLSAIMDHIVEIGNPPRCDAVGLAQASRNIGREEARVIIERLCEAAFLAGANPDGNGSRLGLDEAISEARKFIGAA